MGRGEGSLSVNQSDGILVFDVGGSHIACGLFQPEDMVLSAPAEIRMAGSNTPAEFLAAFESLSRSTLRNSTAAAGVAIAMPNPFDYDRGISFMRHKYEQLYGSDLRQGLGNRLDIDPASILFLNDAAAFLTGELQQGALIGVDRAIGITLGTGVGSAFAIEGKIAVEGGGVPPGGEIWNLPYRDSIVEDVISTRAIQRLYEESSGHRLQVHEIATRAGHDPKARDTFVRFGNELGTVLRHVGLEFRPEKIVLGGGISRAAALFLPSTREVLGDVGMALKVSSLSGHAPLVGAGIAWMQKHMPAATNRRF